MPEDTKSETILGAGGAEVAGAIGRAKRALFHPWAKTPTPFILRPPRILCGLRAESLYARRVFVMNLQASEASACVTTRSAVAHTLRFQSAVST